MDKISKLARLIAAIVCGLTVFLIMWALGLAQGTPVSPESASNNLNDLSNLFSLDLIFLVVKSVLTVPLTSFLKRLLDTHDNATVAANGIVNAISMGLYTLLAGDATIIQALVLTVVGIANDKIVYQAITGQQKQKEGSI